MTYTFIKRQTITRKQARNYYGSRLQDISKRDDFKIITKKGGIGKGFSTSLKKKRGAIQRHIMFGHNVSGENLEWYFKTQPGYYYKHFGELKRYLDENHKGENVCYNCLRQLSRNKLRENVN